VGRRVQEDFRDALILGAWLLLTVLGSGIVFLRSRNRGGLSAQIIECYLKVDVNHEKEYHKRGVVDQLISSEDIGFFNILALLILCM